MSRELILGPHLRLPTQAVTETFGILAARGAGKSNTAAVMAEEMFAAKLPFVVVDPVRAWWGLRSSSDGNGPGIPVPIFGGRHGDVPLEVGGGAFMAQLIVGERLSCVLDLDLFESEGAKKRFLLDFARELYQRNESPLHLFLEEADDYIPQRPMRDEAQLLRAWENIVRRGRGRGLGMTLISQRSAAINKNVLTQVQTLIAMRTTGPQDIAAIREWVKYYQQSEEILASLSGLKDGEAWVWSPHFLQTTKRVQIRRRQTFDSGATPKIGQEHKAPATLADIDLAAVKKRMMSTIEKAKAEDPRELRKQIAELKASLLRATQQKVANTQQKVVEKPILKDSHLKRIEATVCKAETLNERTIKALVEMVGASHELLREIRHAASGLRPQAGPGLVRGEYPRHDDATFDWGQRAESGLIKHSPPARIEAGTGDSTLSGGLRRMMIALAQRMPLSRSQLGIRAGVSPKGGSFDTYLSRARTQGWVDGRGEFVITPAGRKALGSYQPLPTGDALRDYWLNKLGGGARRMLTVLCSVYPATMSRDELGAKADVSPAGGSFDTYMSRLRTLELVEGRGEFRASEELFG